MTNLIWTIFIIPLIISTANAQFIPAIKLDSITYQVTTNRYVDYSVCTSKNVREAGQNAELNEVYKMRNDYLEKRNDELESKPDFTIYAFLGGVILGLLL